MTRLPALRIPRCLLDPSANLPPADAEGLVAVCLEHQGGRITALKPAAAGAEPFREACLASGAGFPDARGQAPALAITPPVDPHVHLDKAFSAAAFPNPAGTMAGALEANLRELEVRRPEQVLERGERALQLAWRHGCRALRSHVDSLGPAAPSAWEALQELRRGWADRLELQLVALAPLRHWASPEGQVQARRVAADGGLLGSVVGGPFGLPSFDRDLLDGLLQLADRLGCAIDLHIDESDTHPARGVRNLVDRLERRPCGVPITCSHASSLALLGDGQLARLADRLAAAGVAVVALPTTNLWLLGKREGHTPFRRPQAPLRQLQAAGVVVAVGSDNVQDPWYPGGAFDPVELLRLVPLLSHQLPWQRRGLVPFTTAAARLLDLPWDGVLREGSPADLLVLGCSGWGELLQRSPQRRVLRGGRWLPPPEPAPSSPWLDGLGPPPC